MSKYYIEVAPTIPLPYSSRQLYTYHLPLQPKETVLHRVVKISFGHRHSITGVVMAVTSHHVPYRTQPATLLPNAPLTDHQVALATWLSRTMQGGLGFTLRLFL